MRQRCSPVVVVGAGPVGLTTALVLARSGVPVTVLERAPALSTASRASTFHPATLELLGELGVAEPLLAQGRRVERIQWRDLDGAIHAELDYRLLTGHTRYPYRLHAEQSRLTPLLLAALAGRAEVRFGAAVTGASQDGSAVRLSVLTEEGLVTWQAGMVVAADGARSRLRELAGLPSTAREYPHYALRLIIDDPLDRLIPDLAPLSYIRDERLSYSLLGMPDHWRMIVRISRSVPREDVTAPEAVRALLARAFPRLTKIPHVADAHTYRLASFLLPRYRSGRLIFLGDAAHLTSTAGGLNMNCGLHDAVDVGRVLAEVVMGHATDADLDAVLERRRSIAESAVIPRSEARTAGLGDRLALRRAIDDIRRVASDPATAREYLIQASLLDCAPRPAITP